MNLLTPALQYIESKGWQFKPSGTDKIELESCPFCHKGGYGHFYLVISNDNRDGLHMCQRCGVSGNLTTLKESQGDRIRGVESVRENWNYKEKIEPLPDVKAAHQALLEDADAMDYLVNTRGFSRKIIQELQIGYTPKRYFRECGEVPAILYPYLVNGNIIFAHWRSLPPAPKAFSSPKGWDAPLYNGHIIQDGLKELIMVEGEANTVCALDHGITDIVGVPGANFKKALWLDTLDKLNLERIYICYDMDKVGQKAAQTLASRIGIEKCWKIVLPNFEITTDDGEVRKGKDLNEWFTKGGGTDEGFQKLKEEAVLFDVQGVVSSKNGLDELEDMLSGKESLEPTYKTPWESLNKLVGWEDGDVIDIVAPEKIGKTTIGMNIMENAVDVYEEDGIIICMEMPTIRLTRKWVSHVTLTDDSIPKTKEEARAKLEQMKFAISLARKKASDRKGELYFCYPQIKDVEDAYKLMVDCIRRYGVKWVMFDNLQLLADRTLKGSHNRTVHLSQISKTMAGIAKDYGIKLIRILQPHRIREGQLVSTNDVDGASQIAKDCDCMLTADREQSKAITKADFAQMGYVESETAFDPKMIVSVGLSRYSCGGYVTLNFDGATSTVTEYDESQRQQFEAARPNPYKLPEEKVAKPVAEEITP